LLFLQQDYVHGKGSRIGFVDIGLLWVVVERWKWVEEEILHVYSQWAGRREEFPVEGCDKHDPIRVDKNV
jgi:hypothetical protein